jgi:hypothetical protein
MEPDIISTDIERRIYTFFGFPEEKTFIKNKLEGLLRPHPQLYLKAVLFHTPRRGTVRGRKKIYEIHMKYNNSCYENNKNFSVHNFMFYRTDRFQQSWSAGAERY